MYPNKIKWHISKQNKHYVYLSNIKMMCTLTKKKKILPQQHKNDMYSSSINMIWHGPQQCKLTCVPATKWHLCTQATSKQPRGKKTMPWNFLKPNKLVWKKKSSETYIGFINIYPGKWTEGYKLHNIPLCFFPWLGLQDTFITIKEIHVCEVSITNSNNDERHG